MQNRNQSSVNYGSSPANAPDGDAHILVQAHSVRQFARVFAPLQQRPDQV